MVNRLDTGLTTGLVDLNAFVGVDGAQTV